MTESELLFQIYQFSLVLARVIGFFLIDPIFGSKAVPNRIRLSLAVLITIVLIPHISIQGLQVPNKLLILTFQIIIELFIGFIIGFILFLTFMAIQLAGKFIDRRMGFAMARVMDPHNSVSSPLMGQFKNILATLIFLSLNGHHYLLKILSDSFKIVGIDKFNASNELILALFRIIGDLFPLAFRIALPILAILFIIDVAFGLVARTVPQINVFIMGLPTKILVGLIFLNLVLANYVNFLEDLFSQKFAEIYRILKLMVE